LGHGHNRADYLYTSDGISLRALHVIFITGSDIIKIEWVVSRLTTLTCELSHPAVYLLQLSMTAGGKFVPKTVWIPKTGVRRRRNYIIPATSG
jgi:hypothetical protein